MIKRVKKKIAGFKESKKHEHEEMKLLHKIDKDVKKKKAKK